MSFTETDYRVADVNLGLNDVPAIKAVTEVESNGVTHWKDGRVPLLFEAQWFHHFTNGIYDDSHPNISSPVWDRSLYRGGYAEYDRQAEAAALDRRAALLSASYGAFQVMGFNYSDLSYSSIDEFVSDMQTDAGQMEAFVRYINKNNLTTALRNHDWRTFTYGYNGPGAIEEYSHKIAEAYDKYDGDVPPSARVTLFKGSYGANVVMLQNALGITADGIFGKNTDTAVRIFQATNHLVVDGIVGPVTWTKLGLH